MSAISDKIRATSDIEKELVPVPQWDVTVEVRSMSAKARVHMLRQATLDDGTIDFESLYPAVLIATCFDPETCESAFSESDADWLIEKSAAPVEALAQVGMRLSGMTKEAVDEGKETS